MSTNDNVENPENTPRKTVGRNGNLLNVGGKHPNSGRKPGSKNRKTLLRKWADVISKKKNPLTGEMIEMSQEDIAALALIFKAQKGDVPAFREMMDTLYGKIQDNLHLTGDVDLSDRIKINIDFEEPPQSES